MQAGAGPIAAFRQPPAVEGVTDPKHDDPGGCLSAPRFPLQPPEAADVPFVATMVTHRAGAWQANIASQYDYVLWIDSDLVEYPPDIPTTLIAANPEARPRPAPATARQQGTGSPAPRWRRATRPRDRPDALSCTGSHCTARAPRGAGADWYRPVLRHDSVCPPRALRHLRRPVRPLCAQPRPRAPERHPGVASFRQRLRALHAGHPT